MDHRIAAGNCAPEERYVAHVSLDFFKPGVVLHGPEHVIAVQVQVEHPYPVSRIEQRRHERGADITRTSRHINSSWLLVAHACIPRRMRSAMLCSRNSWPISTIP